MARQNIEKLVWIDLETTGLDPKKDKIIEIACVVTDTNLNVLDPNGFVSFIHISKQDVNKMIPVVKEMQMKNGLIKTCLSSKETLESTQEALILYLSEFLSPKESPLCGNTISTDRMFIELYLPELSKFLHYRNIDVSTVMQLCKMWGLKEYHKTASQHEGLGDILSSIEEMKFYKKEIFDQI